MNKTIFTAASCLISKLAYICISKILLINMLKDPKEELQYIGTISGTKGFKGEMELKDIPEGINKLASNSRIFIGFSPAFTNEFILNSFQKKSKSGKISAEEIRSDKDAKEFLERGVFVERKNILLENKSQLTDDIVGLEVYDEKQSFVGVVKEVWYLPGNDVFYTKTAEGFLPIPVINDVVQEINLKLGRINVNMIDGLWDLLETD